MYVSGLTRWIEPASVRTSRNGKRVGSVDTTDAARVNHVKESVGPSSRLSPPLDKGRVDITTPLNSISSVPNDQSNVFNRKSEWPYMLCRPDGLFPSVP